MTDVERGRLKVSGSEDAPLLSVTARFIRAAGLPAGERVDVLGADGLVVITAPDVEVDPLVQDLAVAPELAPNGGVDDERVAALDAIWEDVTGEAVSR